MENLIITYSEACARKGHIDHNFTQLVYGDSKRALKKIEKGSPIFFNTRIGQSRYITAYFKVRKILIRGTDDTEISKLNCAAKNDDIIIIGNRNTFHIFQFQDI